MWWGAVPPGENPREARIRSAETSHWTVAAPTASTEAFWGVNGDVKSISATASDQKSPSAVRILAYVLAYRGF